MLFPEFLELGVLEVRSDTWKDLAPTWEIIADLRDGASTLVRKAAKYIPKRPGEKPDVYQLRLDKFSYTPVMSTAVREFTAKLVSSPIVVSGADSDFWARFRENLDRSGSDESEVLNQILSKLLYFGRVFIGCDRPALGFVPRSQAEVPDTADPFIVLYEPLHVINQGKGWYLTRQIVEDNQPTVSRKILRFQYWTETEIATYEIECQVDEYGKVTRVKKPLRNGYPSPKTLIPRVGEPVRHGLGRNPMLELVLPVEMWVGNLAYLKQLQHTRIESSWTDAGTVAGTVQRVYTPPAPVPTDDPRILLEQPKYQDLDFTGSHVLVGAGFKFEESSGSAIGALTSQLATIEQQIRELVSMGYLNHQAASQSGAAKEVDMSLITDTMRSYGKKVARLYQDVLQLVARMVNQDPDAISVQGLEDYSVDTLDKMVDLTIKMLPIVDSFPDLVTQIWVSKICRLMTGTLSPEQTGQVAAELENVFLTSGTFEQALQDSGDPTSSLDAET